MEDCFPLITQIKYVKDVFFLRETTSRDKRPLEHIHMDGCGPIKQVDMEIDISSNKWKKHHHHHQR